MTNNQAKIEGIKGYNDGRMVAPALNNEFIRNACASSTKTVDLLKSYTHGWTIANLSDGSTDPTLPSVIELDRIVNG